MKNRLTALFLSICIVCCLSACNSTSADNKETKEESDHIHQYTEATCVTPKSCSCGDTIGIALDHNFEVATCTSPKICSRCNEIDGEPLGHDYVEATCVSPKFCKRCDSVLENELGHDFVDGKCTRCEEYDRTYLIEDIDYLKKSDYLYCEQTSVTDNQGTVHNQNYIFYSLGENNIHFQIDKKYKSFSGTAFISYNQRGSGNRGYIKIYGDDKLLYQTKDMMMGHIPETFTIDIKGISVLKIEFHGYSSLISDSTNVYLTDAYLVK